MPEPENKEDWESAEYRTANIAPQSAMTEPVFKAMHQILTSSFSIRLPNGKQTRNKCMIEWFYLKERTLNTPPYKQFFANNSYIEHRSLGADQGDALQGKPFGLITYDEACRSLHLEEEVDGNLIPRLFDWGGQLYLLSTPDTNSPSLLYFYELYQKGMNGVENHYTQEGSIRENTFFTKEQIDQEYELHKDNPMKDQILEGKFVFGGDSLFGADSIAEAMTKDLNGGKPPQKGHQYSIGIDTALGSDECVYAVIDRTDPDDFQLVHLRAKKGSDVSPEVHIQELQELVYEYWDGETQNVSVFLETWNGESARFYLDMPYDIQGITKCYGSWQPNKNRTTNQNKAKPKTSTIKKADILVALKNKLHKKQLKLPQDNEKLRQQLSIYKEKDGNIPTDRVIALALAVYDAEEKAKQPILQWEELEW